MTYWLPDAIVDFVLSEKLVYLWNPFVSLSLNVQLCLISLSMNNFKEIKKVNNKLTTKPAGTQKPSSPPIYRTFIVRSAQDFQHGGDAMFANDT